MDSFPLGTEVGIDSGDEDGSFWEADIGGVEELAADVGWGDGIWVECGDVKAWVTELGEGEVDSAQACEHVASGAAGACEADLNGGTGPMSEWVISVQLSSPVLCLVGAILRWGSV